MFHSFTPQNESHIRGWLCFGACRAKEKDVLHVLTSSCFFIGSERSIAVKKVSGKTHTKEQLDNWANQNNPNNDAYWANQDNHANQCNPNNDEYWHSREEDDD